MHQTYHNKRVIWESKRKQIGLVLQASVFVAIAFVLKRSYPPYVFWIITIFFGSIGLMILIRLLHPRNLFVTPGSQLGEKILAEQSRQAQEDLGVFTYDKIGFFFKSNESETYYHWSDIETIFSYEEERDVDEMCLDLFMNSDALLNISESTAGWYQFILQLKKHIPLAPFSWDSEIDDPPYEPYLTLLFDKKGRSQEIVEAIRYPE
jgi:hypothetical protein